MKAYVSGERKHALMKALLANANETEFNSMAVYYARQVPARAQTASTGDPAAGKTASAACAGCHGDQGVSANAQWPSLAGQDARYLAAAIKAYKDGSRGDATMKALVASLDESTINNLAAYYASLPPAQPSIPASMQNIPARQDPVLVVNGVVAGLDSRTIADVASYFASLGPERSKHGDHGGKREPVVIRNYLVASLDERTIANVASYYATQRPEQPEGGRGVAGGAAARARRGRAPADGSSVGGIISFRKNDPSRRVEDNNAICLNCHERGERTYWRGSVHEERAVACTELPHHHEKRVGNAPIEDGVGAQHLLPVPQGPAGADLPLITHARARGQDHLLELSQPARQHHRGAVARSLDQRQLLQVPRRKARTVPVRACTSARELSELP